MYLAGLLVRLTGLVQTGNSIRSHGKSGQVQNMTYIRGCRYYRYACFEVSLLPVDGKWWPSGRSAVQDEDDDEDHTGSEQANTNTTNRFQHRQRVKNGEKRRVE